MLFNAHEASICEASWARQQRIVAADFQMCLPVLVYQRNDKQEDTLPGGITVSVLYAKNAKGN